MASSNTIRWSGLAAMLGGALFVVSAVVIASMPRGCIGGECASRPMRETGAAGASLILALLLVVIGAAGLAVLRARVLPRWAAVLLVIGALAMLGFNDQNAQALVAIPFGIAWVVVGYVLWSGRGEEARQPARAHGDEGGSRAIRGKSTLPGSLPCAYPSNRWACPG